MSRRIALSVFMLALLLPILGINFPRIEKVAAAPIKTINVTKDIVIDYSNFVLSGDTGFIRVRWNPDNESSYYIFYLVPPPEIQVNNSLFPIAFNVSLTIPHVERTRRDPSFTWNFTYKTNFKKTLRFRLLMISTNYNISNPRYIDPSINRIVAEMRLNFGKAYLSEEVLDIEYYNITGVENYYKRQINELSKQLNGMMSKVSSAYAEAQKYRSLAQKLNATNIALNLTIYNLTKMLKDEWATNRLVGMSTSVVGLLVFMFVIPFVIASKKNREYDLSFAGRKRK
ncbi:MAG: hypothetical protein DRN78_02225 [Thermoproteota archaeon]|nr:MAG: hypothetical protein DRN78_02225 [Candidatus Korarchaeota archaeon]